MIYLPPRLHGSGCQRRRLPPESAGSKSTGQKTALVDNQPNPLLGYGTDVVVHADQFQAIVRRSVRRRLTITGK
jgi:hypothetical protein